MQITPALEKVFTEVYGKPCWNVKPGHGSFLTFEFGVPHLEVREPIIASKDASARVQKALARRSVFVHGQWHLMIYCCEWEVVSKRRRVGDSSTKFKIQCAADLLNGQKLTRFSFSPQKVRCVFEFDLGATLRTMPYDKDSVQWSLYTPSRRVLVLRADGRYKYMRSDIPSDQGVWKSVLN